MAFPHEESFGRSGGVKSNMTAKGIPKGVRDESKRANMETNRPSSFVRISTVALVLLVIGAIIFGPFLFGPKLLLYKDIGSDSVNDDYPTFAHLSDYIRTVGVPSWSFQVGLGQSIFPLASFLLFNPVAWLPKA